MKEPLLALLAVLAGAWPGRAEPLNPDPPSAPVKLVFIHHSTGENLLRDDYGGLGLALKTNRYFVSDSNYGWGPNAIGDRTDIPDWAEWFRSAGTPIYMGALYAESESHSSYSRLAHDPGGANDVVLFKSCFPNSNLAGSPGDPPSADGWLTVGHAKWVYNRILAYFGRHPDKLFVAFTAPPVSDPTFAPNARAFNQWLVNDWLSENGYPFRNVAVFDFYNILTHTNAHHRFNADAGTIEHAVVAGHDTLAYPSGDDHPSEAGSRKAVAEFVPLLNVFYNDWKSNCVARTATGYSDPARDGWIREAGETGEVGGAVRTNGLLVVGDDDANRQCRAILSFGVDVPSNAVILAATVKIKRQGTVGVNPFVTHGRLLADVRRNGFGAEPRLAGEDFQAPATQSGIASVSTAEANGWHKLAFPEAALPCFKPQRLVQVRLRFETDDNGDRAMDAIRFFGGEAAADDRPRLILRTITPPGE